MDAELVPFGKYKGQPVEILAADSDYCEWLVAQPWFSARYRDVYNIVVNYGAEPQDSPEHNEMQVRFLDEDWCRRVAVRLYARGLGGDEIRGLRFEDRGWDVCYDVTVRCDEDCHAGDCKVSESVFIECKPDLGDDYPAVLRQVQQYPSYRYLATGRCVLVRRHAFKAVTWEQVQKVFATSSIKLIAESEV